jgi:hypothetical protein
MQPMRRYGLSVGDLASARITPLAGSTQADEIMTPSERAGVVAAIRQMGEDIARAEDVYPSVPELLERLRAAYDRRIRRMNAAAVHASCGGCNTRLGFYGYFRRNGMVCFLFLRFAIAMLIILLVFPSALPRKLNLA